MAKRVVVGISGATGPIYGIRLLEALSEAGVESHLILSKWARATINIETDYTVEQVIQMATVLHSFDNQAASVSSGSYPVDGMVIIPCSMKTVASVRVGLADNLLARTADVTLKEGRRLIIVPRESPLSTIHLENLLALSRMGVAIIPPMPAFYNNPKTILDVVDHTVARVLDHLGIDNNLSARWGPKKGQAFEED